MEDEFNVKWSLYKWCSAFLLKADDDGGVPNADNANAVAWKDLGGGGVLGPGVCVGCFSTCNAEITTASRLWYLFMISFQMTLICCIRRLECRISYIVLFTELIKQEKCYTRDYLWV
jgi:hypothetical protein